MTAGRSLQYSAVTGIQSGVSSLVSPDFFQCAATANYSGQRFLNMFAQTFLRGILLRKLSLICFAALLFAGGVFPSPVVYGQQFSRVIDPANPILSAVGPVQYAGASWVDYDNDGDPDLFINNNRLYRNDGNGVFVALATSLGQTQPANNQITGYGNSWADYDNDGDLDCFISSATSFLYRNDGNGIFTQITDGEIGNGFANRGWSCAWADYDNDGYVDLSITHPAGFAPGGATTNHLFHNSGPPDYSFTRVSDTEITMNFAPFTVGTWSDFDLDGDLDYFIGSGPANGNPARDYLFRNLLIESGEAVFLRLTEGVMATDLQDGQVWNWIDIDNDRDLDAYLTNWGGDNFSNGKANRLYRNDEGTFVRIESGAIVTDIGISLASVWGDYDNDGDLDCYVANDKSTPDKFYQNNGDGTFTSIAEPLFAQGLTHRGATAADYDNDGDLDLLAVGTGNATALYRNDLDNGNHWIGITCVGTVSNRAAIGAKVSVRAMIGGVPVWQMREISAQNTFNGQNDLRVHLGLGDAAQIDSVVVIWPSGIVDVLENLEADQFITVRENQSLSVGVRDLEPRVNFISVHPNPYVGQTALSYQLSHRSVVELNVYDVLGKEITTLVDNQMEAGEHTTVWDGSTADGTSVSEGVYLYVLRVGQASWSGVIYNIDAN